MTLKTENGWHIGGIEVVIGLGDMTEGAADAYVIPQFAKAVSEGGVAAAVARAGAELGAIDEFAAILAREETPLTFGRAFVVPSHGGKTNKLIHVVSVASGVENEFRTVVLSVGSALRAAVEEGMTSVVFPVLATGILRALTDDQAARAMFAGVDRFVAANPQVRLQMTVVAWGFPQVGPTPLYEALKNVLSSRSYADVLSEVGTQPIDPERWQAEMNRDIKLGTSPLPPVGEPTDRRRRKNRGATQDDASPLKNTP